MAAKLRSGRDGNEQGAVGGPSSSRSKGWASDTASARCPHCDLSHLGIFRPVTVRSRSATVSGSAA